VVRVVECLSEKYKALSSNNQCYKQQQQQQNAEVREKDKKGGYTFVLAVSLAFSSACKLPSPPSFETGSSYVCSPGWPHPPASVPCARIVGVCQPPHLISPFIMHI
jgi:hypothetical protein